ncbi:MAG: GIY-YIG nuclease family protein [Phaeodactylibacter sp.]|nr:GIY-YIG nuclease family protein [Phaeodactylibacter sp.]
MAMPEKRYAIIDVETTGGRASRDKITEIAIVVHDGQQILDRFETLLNPEMPIPYGITQLTGINQDMVEKAPKFYEIAKQVVEMTEGAVFVAHNVRFDYSFIREEFKRLGYTYTRKTLCTVRLSRKAFPGLPSYSLGNLIRYFNISVSDRHRAMADTLATVTLFEKILAKDQATETVEELVNLSIKESLLPKSISLERLHALPEACGVYYFHNEAGQVVYVGKSINIKKRVATHFSKKSHKAGKLQQQVHDISFEITGSELVALLLESYEIKRLRPSINRAQRMQLFPYAVYAIRNDAGFWTLQADKAKEVDADDRIRLVAEFARLSNAKNSIKAALRDYELCSKLCNLEKGSGPCFQFHLKNCHGACAGEEDADSYNARIDLALERMSTELEGSYVLIDEGPSTEEHAVILVRDGAYQGFGFVEKESDMELEQLLDAVKIYPNNPEARRIIRRQLEENESLKQIPLQD